MKPRQLSLVGCFVAGCIGSSSAPEGQRAEGTSTDAEQGAISVMQVEGVWIFAHDPDGGDDALLSGPATIRDGCLVVEDFVVVWHVDRLADASAAVTALNAGETPVMAVGGSGLSLSEGAPIEPFPADLLARCPTEKNVWFN